MLFSPPKRLISFPIIEMLPVSLLSLKVDITLRLRVSSDLSSIFPPLCLPSALIFSMSILVAAFILTFPPRPFEEVVSIFTLVILMLPV